MSDALPTVMGYINAAQLTGMKTLHTFANINLFDPHKDLGEIARGGKAPTAPSQLGSCW